MAEESLLSSFFSFLTCFHRCVIFILDILHWCLCLRLSCRCYRCCLFCRELNRAGRQETISKMVYFAIGSKISNPVLVAIKYTDFRQTNMIFSTNTFLRLKKHTNILLLHTDCFRCQVKNTSHFDILPQCSCILSVRILHEFSNESANVHKKIKYKRPFKEMCMHALANERVHYLRKKTRSE